MNGYQEAEKIDEQINQIFSNHPISEDNGMEWWKFARTVRSGLEIIEERTKEIIDLQTKKAASKNSGRDIGEFKAVGPTS